MKEAEQNFTNTMKITNAAADAANAKAINAINANTTNTTTDSLDSQLSQAENKQCQGLQASIPVLGDMGADPKTLGDLQNLINKAC